MNPALDYRPRIALAKVLSQNNHRLLKKWYLSSRIMFLVHGNGQRSQVYTRLQKPTEDELEQFCEKLASEIQ